MEPKSGMRASERFQWVVDQLTYLEGRISTLSKQLERERANIEKLRRKVDGESEIIIAGDKANGP